MARELANSARNHAEGGQKMFDRLEAVRGRDSWKPLPERTHRQLKPILVLIDAKRLDEAKERTADILELSPRNGAALALLIKIHGYLGEIGLSEHLFSYALRTGMGHARMYSAMVGAYVHCGQFEKALQTITDAEEDGKGNERMYLHFMKGLYTEGKYGEIENFYRALPQKYQAKPCIAIKYADALRKMGKYAKAIGIASLTLSMHSTLEDKTKAKMVIAYSEISRGNTETAFGLLSGIYCGISWMEDYGISFSFFPRLLCGMVFACSKGGIPQTVSTVEHWRWMLMRIKQDGRGKPQDAINALRCINDIPIATPQNEL